ncbi:FxsB family cyclophane-forming radical SAM/SPASM peptide maturase [Amycolatopsis sp. NPDC051128]|uniref:FxsB family cyclophane-forming radical SAM/SPASM peptide maturase n=1 Tax=Amycolatopsis sp. NPDC051128 TaxID=3155412 RepID=UPI00343BCD95
MPDVPPIPFRQFIIKVHSRCNLACDYCYVYTKADERWRSRPQVMTPRVVEFTVRRVAEHVRVHGLDEAEVILHGGEPLLAGPGTIGRLVSDLRLAVPARLKVTVQTNGTLLDEDFLNLFRELRVRVGVSLDGDAAAHDRHRVGPSGRGSHRDVQRALAALTSREYRHLFAGLLCTVDLVNDPVTTYEALLEYEPPIVDFLLPHGNWTNPPPGLPAGPGATPYADWLIALFDRWYSAPERETGVRVFDEILAVLLGGHSRLEGVGLGPAAMIVIETDGMIEQSDILASTFEGAAATGLHVARDSFDAAWGVPAVTARRNELADLCETCRSCRHRVVCGGGLPAHRYRADDGFDNPSVYCPDLYRLAGHIRDRVSADLAELRRATR